uniref:Uncharacterized protein n=1 Tax=Macrostomum lignano TaxID=282301 RepID=A0A1I8GIB8_9PLAT
MDTEESATDPEELMRQHLAGSSGALSTMVDEEAESCLSVSGDSEPRQHATTYRIYNKSNRRFLDSPSPVELGRQFEFPDAAVANNDCDDDDKRQSASPAMDTEESATDPEELMRQHLAGSSDILRSLWEHQMRCEASAIASNSRCADNSDRGGN